ncbi:MAG TPA: hypothetical protein VGV86_02350 [Acidimicrobiales bacterium]|nr:hypothetical protein [Acidimicrobiales bacterium]
MPRHDVDVLSLMAGVGFAGLAVISLLSEGTGVAARWTWPILLILVGVIGLVASRRDRKP